MFGLEAEAEEISPAPEETAENQGQNSPESVKAIVLDSVSNSPPDSIKTIVMDESPDQQNVHKSPEIIDLGDTPLASSERAIETSQIIDQAVDMGNDNGITEFLLNDYYVQPRTPMKQRLRSSTRQRSIASQQNKENRSLLSTERTPSAKVTRASRRIKQPPQIYTPSPVRRSVRIDGQKRKHIDETGNKNVRPPSKRAKIGAGNVKLGGRRMLVILTPIDQINGVCDDDSVIGAALEAALVNGNVDDGIRSQAMDPFQAADDELRNLDPEEAAERWEAQKNRHSGILGRKRSVADGLTAKKNVENNTDDGQAVDGNVSKKRMESNNGQRKSGRNNPIISFQIGQGAVANSGQTSQNGFKTSKTERNNGQETSTSGPSNSDAVAPANFPQFNIVSGDPCKFCSHICGRSTPLQRHLAHHHQFRCETCVVQFQTEAALKKHRVDAHTTRYRCELCEKDYPSLKRYQNHTKSTLHQLVSKGQAKLYNEIVEKWKFSQTYNIQTLDDDNDKDIICGRTVKEEQVDRSNNVQIIRSSVSDFVCEQAAKIEFAAEEPRVQVIYATDSGNSSAADTADQPETDYQSEMFQSIPEWRDVTNSVVVDTSDYRPVEQELIYPSIIQRQPENMMDTYRECNQESNYPIFEELQPVLNPSMMALRSAFTDNTQHHCQSIEMSAIAQMISGHYNLEPLQEVFDASEQPVLENSGAEPVGPDFQQHPILEKSTAEPIDTATRIQQREILGSGKKLIMERITQMLSVSGQDVQELAYDADVLDRPSSPIDLAQIESDSAIDDDDTSDAMNALVAKLTPNTTITMNELDEMGRTEQILDLDGFGDPKTKNDPLLDGDDPNVMDKSPMLSEGNIMGDDQDSFTASLDNGGPSTMDEIMSNVGFDVALIGNTPLLGYQ